MISSPGCVCRGDACPGAISTIAWMVSRPGMLRSCRWRSMRLVVGCCASACSARPPAPMSAATAMIRVVFMCISSVRRANGRERGTQLGREELGLLPRREVPAFVDLVEIAQVGIRAARPGLRGPIDVVRKYGDSHGELDLRG